LLLATLQHHPQVRIATFLQIIHPNLVEMNEDNQVLVEILTKNIKKNYF